MGVHYSSTHVPLSHSAFWSVSSSVFVPLTYFWPWFTCVATSAPWVLHGAVDVVLIPALPPPPSHSHTCAHGTLLLLSSPHALHAHACLHRAAPSGLRCNAFSNKEMFHSHVHDGSARVQEEGITLTHSCVGFLVLINQ